MTTDRYVHRSLLRPHFIASMLKNPPKLSKLLRMISVCHRQPVHDTEEYRKYHIQNLHLAQCKSYIYSWNVKNNSSDFLQFIHYFHRYWETYAISSSVKGVSSIKNSNCEELNILANSR